MDGRLHFQAEIKNAHDLAASSCQQGQLRTNADLFAKHLVGEKTTFGSPVGIALVIELNVIARGAERVDQIEPDMRYHERRSISRSRIAGERRQIDDRRIVEFVVVERHFSGMLMWTDSMPIRSKRPARFSISSTHCRSLASFR